MKGNDANIPRLSDNAVVKNKDVSTVTASVGISNEWRYFASAELVVA